MSCDNSQDVKGRYWQALMYPENMIDDWEDVIYEKLQLPFAYCIHDECTTKKDGEKRKVHVHIIIAYGNNTTENSALNTFKSLEKSGCVAIPNDKIEKVKNIRRAYDYLIHDTDDCRKKKKHLYPAAARITGNGFDIGSYDQLSLADKKRIKIEISNIIVSERVTNFFDLYMIVASNYDDEYFDILTTYSNFYEKLTRGLYQKISEQRLKESQQDEP